MSSAGRINNLETNAKVVVTTTIGDFDVELFKDIPYASRNFLKLCARGYYDNKPMSCVDFNKRLFSHDIYTPGVVESTLHDVDEPFRDEIHSALRWTQRGLLGSYGAGKHSNTSIFFFNLAPTPEYNDKHTIFGRITGATLFNINKILDKPLHDDHHLATPITILSAKIITNPYPDVITPTQVGSIGGEGDGAEKKKKKEVKKKLNSKLLSFGDDDEDDGMGAGVLSFTEMKKVMNKKARSNAGSAVANDTTTENSQQPPEQSRDQQQQQQQPSSAVAFDNNATATTETTTATTTSKNTTQPRSNPSHTLPQSVGKFGEQPAEQLIAIEDYVTQAKRTQSFQPRRAKADGESKVDLLKERLAKAAAVNREILSAQEEFVVQAELKAKQHDDIPPDDVNKVEHRRVHGSKRDNDVVSDYSDYSDNDNDGYDDATDDDDDHVSHVPRSALLNAEYEQQNKARAHKDVSAALIQSGRHIEQYDDDVYDHAKHDEGRGRSKHSDERKHRDKPRDERRHRRKDARDDDEYSSARYEKRHPRHHRSNRDYSHDDDADGKDSSKYDSDRIRGDTHEDTSRHRKRNDQDDGGDDKRRREKRSARDERDGAPRGGNGDGDDDRYVGRDRDEKHRYKHSRQERDGRDRRIEKDRERNRDYDDKYQKKKDSKRSRRDSDDDYTYNSSRDHQP